jgi:hypothetical protein
MTEGTNIRFAIIVFGTALLYQIGDLIPGIGRHGGLNPLLLFAATVIMVLSIIAMDSTGQFRR